MTAADRVERLCAAGIELFLGDAGELRVRCEPDFVALLEAAMPSVVMHKAAIIEYLKSVTPRPA